MQQIIECGGKGGGRIELLVNGTEHLLACSVAFRNVSRSLQRVVWWKNMKLIMGLGLKIVVFL